MANLLGSLLGFLGPKPKAVIPERVNAQQEQRKAVAGNTSVIPEVISQTDELNTAQTKITDKLLAQASGGVYGKLRDKALENIGYDLKGGRDISDILRGTAAGNLLRGTAGTPAGFATSLNRSVSQIEANQARGFSSLERWLSGVNQTYRPVDISGMFQRSSISPEFQSNLTWQQNLGIANAQTNASVLKAKSSPFNALAGSLGDMAGGLGAALSGYLGDAGGIGEGFGGLLGVASGGGAKSWTQAFNGFGFKSKPKSSFDDYGFRL